MKKFICVIFAICMLFGFSSCKKNGLPYVKQDPVVLEQEKEINALGATEKNKKLVVFAHTNEYVKYIVANYDENGTKKDEAVYLYYISEYCYNQALPTFDSTKISTDASLWLISYSGNNCDMGSFDADRDKLKAEYYIK